MNDCYINTFHKSYSVGCKNTSPRKAFVKYYQDLYLSENYGEISEASFTCGGQYNFVELSRPLLTYYKGRDDLASTDLIIFATASEEFDPIHSYGHALINEYNIQCRVIDIADRGILSIFIAIKVACVYLTHEGIDRVLLLFLEQSTIPRADHDKTVIPTLSGGLSFFIDGMTQRIKKTVIDAQLASIKSCQQSICQLIAKYTQIDKKIMLVICHQGTTLDSRFVKNDWNKRIEIIHVKTVSEMFTRMLNRFDKSLMIGVTKSQESPEYALLLLDDEEKVS